MAFLLATPALLLLLFIYGWPLLRYGWLSFHADSVLTGLQPVPNGGRTGPALFLTIASGKTFCRPVALPWCRWGWNWFWHWESRCCSINAGGGVEASEP